MISEYIELNAAQEREIEARAAAREQRIVDAYQVAHNEAMAGRGEFWNDCHQSVYDAVRAAMGSGLMHENKWKIVEKAIRDEASKYATAVSQDTD